MWSKRIGTPVPLYTPVVYQPKKAIEWPNQYEYDEWLKKQNIWAGDLLCYRHIPNLIHAQWPSIIAVLKIEDDLPSLTYNRQNGMPMFLYVCGIYPSQVETVERYEDFSSFRRMTQEELKWVQENVVLQNNLQAKLPDFKPNYGNHQGIGVSESPPAESV